MRNKIVLWCRVTEKLNLIAPSSAQMPQRFDSSVVQDNTQE
jgi:hypothetical protein